MEGEGAGTVAFSLLLFVAIFNDSFVDTKTSIVHQTTLVDSHLKKKTSDLKQLRKLNGQNEHLHLELIRDGSGISQSYKVHRIYQVVTSQWLLI